MSVYGFFRYVVLERLTLHIALFKVTLKRAQISLNVLLVQYFNSSLLVYNACLCHRYLVVSEEWEHSWRWLQGHERQHCTGMCVYVCWWLCVRVMPPVMSLSPLGSLGWLWEEYFLFRTSVYREKHLSQVDKKELTENRGSSFMEKLMQSKIMQSAKF